MFLSLLLKHKRVALEVVGATLLAILIGVHVHDQFNPTIITVQTAPTTTTVYVDNPIITERIVTKILTDPKDKVIIQGLLDENKKLGLQVTNLSQTLADLQSKGGGEVTPVEPKAPLQADQLYTFKDYRLNATFNTKQFSYTLTQKFEILSSSAKVQATGQQVRITKLYELGPNGERTEVPSKTIDIQANPSVSKFRVGLRLQGGAIYSQNKELAGLIGVQWLRHGTSNAAEDSRWAILTPVARLSGTTHEAGVLLFSYNVGTLRHSPFSNLWLSPYVSPSGVTQVRTIGLGLSATF